MNALPLSTVSSHFSDDSSSARSVVTVAPAFLRSVSKTKESMKSSKAWQSKSQENKQEQEDEVEKEEKEEEQENQMQEEDLPMVVEAKMWCALARSASQPQQQMEFYQHALDALRAGNSYALEAVEYLLEFGEWLYDHGYSAHEATQYLYTAIDLIQQIDPEAAEDDEVMSSAHSLIARSIRSGHSRTAASVRRPHPPLRAKSIASSAVSVTSSTSGGGSRERSPVASVVRSPKSVKSTKVKSHAGEYDVHHVSIDMYKGANKRTLCSICLLVCIYITIQRVPTARISNTNPCDCCIVPCSWKRVQQLQHLRQQAAHEHPRPRSGHPNLCEIGTNGL